jgi:uncharacterized protein YjbJ (UPF0337 family)
MNKDMAQGLWKQIRGGIRERCGKLLSDDRLRLQGRHERISGKLQGGVGRAHLAITQLEQRLQRYRRV